MLRIGDITMPGHRDELPTLTKRKIQAEVIGPIYTEMVETIGEEKAQAILDTAIRKAAVAEGRHFAALAPGGTTSMADFIRLYDLWTHDGALEIEVLEATDTTFDFDVTRVGFFTINRECLEHVLKAHAVVCLFPHLFCEVEVTLGCVDVWVDTKCQSFVDK